MEEATRQRLPVAVLRYRDYRLLWGGQFVSMLGSQMHTVALSWQVYQLTGSTVQLGLLGLVRAFALMSASFAGGAVADRYDRRHVMLVTQVLLLLLAAVLAVTTSLGFVTIWLLFLIAALQAATTAFDGPARQALVPALVPREQMAPAMSLLMLSSSVARLAGPAVGGLAVGIIGVSGAYALDAASFLAVIWALLVMHARPVTPLLAVRGLEAIAEGLAFIRRTPVVWGVMLLDFLATLLGSTVGLAPVFAEDVLRIGPEGLGLLLSAPALGAVLGGFLVSFVPGLSRPGRLVVLSVMAYGGCLILFGLSNGLLLALLALAGAGAADAVSMAMRHTVRNLATPDDLRGRVAAAHSALAMGGPRLGEFQAGVTASFVGAQVAMVIGGIGCVAIAGAIAKLVPPVMRYDTHDEDAFAMPQGMSAAPAGKAAGDD